MRRLLALFFATTSPLGCSGDAPTAAVKAGAATDAGTPQPRPTADPDRSGEAPPPPEARDGATPTAPDDASATPPDPAAPEAEPPPPPDPLHGEVGPGDSLSRILSRAGLDPQTIHAVAQAMTPLADPTKIREGQRYDIELADDGALVSFAFRTGKITSVVVTPDADGKLTAEEQRLETDVREESIAGTVESSLWGALVDRGHSPALVDVIVDVFAYDIDFFTATRKGDEFRVIVERHEIDGELVKYGKVLAAEYVGIGDPVRIVWWQPKGASEGTHVDPEGRGVARTLLKTPLKYSRISSGFDPKRMHPVLHTVKSHNGVDYAAPEGTPIWAAADGTITFRGKKGGAGNLVVVKHAGGLRTLYMHMSKFADGQRVGTKVKAKTVIGYVGMTGLATGPHLHFGVKKNGRYVDPTSVESVRIGGVGKKNRKAFERERDALLKRLAGATPETSPAPALGPEPDPDSGPGPEPDPAPQREE